MQFHGQDQEDRQSLPHPQDQSWANLTTVDEVEAWIEQHNRDLQQRITKKNAVGCGVCFCLTHGGEIYMHTTEEAILLDVSPDAAWVVPVLAAATGAEPPPAQVWILPDDVLTQLVLGLSSLIATSRIVLAHDFKGKK